MLDPGYVREPDALVVHDSPTQATARGRWTGRWRHRLRDEVMRGVYFARWRHTDVGWLTASELFVRQE